MSANNELLKTITTAISFPHAVGSIKFNVEEATVEELDALISFLARVHKQNQQMVQHLIIRRNAMSVDAKPGYKLNEPLERSPFNADVPLSIDGKLPPRHERG